MRETYDKLAILNGAYSNLTWYVQEGRNPLIGTATVPEDIWNGGGIYTGFPTETETVSIVSTSSADANGSTGAWSVQLIGLDGNFREISEVILLNGLTPVTSVFTYRRLANALIVKAGSTQSNTGDITINHTTTTTNVFAVIPIATGNTQIAAGTVPLDKTLIIDDIYAAMGRAGGLPGSAVIAFEYRDCCLPNGAWISRKIEDLTTAFPAHPPVGRVLPALTDWRFRVISVSDNLTSLTATLSGYLKA
jgi:hypothetical protein